METSSNVLWTNMTSNDTEDVILEIVDDLNLNAEISVNSFKVCLGDLILNIK